MKTFPLQIDFLRFYQLVKDDRGWSVVSQDGHVLVNPESKLAIAFRLAVARSKIWSGRTLCN